MTDESSQQKVLKMTLGDREQPVWARPEAFAVADAGWGWVDRKGRRTPCESFEELSAEIVKDAGARVDLVWTPACDYLVLPEELPELHPAMRDARIRWAQWEMDEGWRQMILFGAFLLGLVAYSKFSGNPLMAFGPAGLALLLFIVLGVIPWYQGRKRLQRAETRALVASPADLEEIRFDTWLMHQKTPLTLVLLAMIGVVGMCQWLGAASLKESVAAAGLTKIDGRASDWWRLLTAPFLHGHWIHLLMNGSALYYLGRRMEVLTRWPHVVMVFLMSSWVAGEASARFVAAPSVGASGGLMGMLGFLLVFELLHRALVPQMATRRLLLGLLLTGVIGVIFPFIDNAAHIGGLVAGMVYAFALFPKSNSTRRPRQTSADRLIGVLAFGVLLLSAGWACLRLVG